MVVSRKIKGSLVNTTDIAIQDMGYANIIAIGLIDEDTASATDRVQCPHADGIPAGLEMSILNTKAMTIHPGQACISYN